MKKRNERWNYVLLAVLVFLSRVPFLFDGFGLDGDSWSVAITAKEIHSTGEYVASRFPGYPVHEIISSLLIGWGSFGLNLFSAVFSTIAVLFFAMTLRYLRFKYIFLAAATFAVVPVFWIHSTTTIDYVIAMGFIMPAMYFLLRGKLVLAGILMGFAIGTRMTSGAMLIPFSILVSANDGFRKNFVRMAKVVLPALVTGFILFIPVMQTYGLSFLTYYDFPYPSIPKVLFKFSFDVWGVPGILGIILSTFLLFLPDRITAKKFLFPRSVNEKFVIAWLVAIDLYIIAYLKLPMESGYLIPLIPFVILIFGRYLYNKAFVFFCVMLIMSSVFGTITPKERFDGATPSKASFVFNAGGESLYFDLLNGPVWSYKSRRENGIHFVNELLSSTDTIARKSVLVSGKWYNQMIVQCEDTSKLKMLVRDYLDEPEATYFYAKGFTIYFLPKQDMYNQIMRNVDLDVYHAVPYLSQEK